MDVLENILGNILSCTMYKTGKENKRINFNKFIWVRIEENDFLGFYSLKLKKIGENKIL